MSAVVWWTERYGDDSFGYALIDWCEETLEFVGVTLFASTLLARLEGRQLRLTPRADAPAAAARSAPTISATCGAPW